MRRWLAVGLIVSGCAARPSAPVAGPLGSPMAVPLLKEATRALRKGDARSAERILRMLVPDDGEAAAAAAFDAVLRDYASLEPEQASEALSEIVATWPTSSAAGYAVDLLAELAIVGAPAAGLDGVRWLQGEGAYADAPVTVLVFWETWCPYCRQEVPKLQALLDAQGHRGLQVLGLLRLSRGTEGAEVEAFAAEHGLRFPLGQDPGDLSEAFAVRGVPAVAVVKDGVVAWRGHPMMLTEARVESLLAPK